MQNGYLANPVVKGANSEGFSVQGKSKECGSYECHYTPQTFTFSKKVSLVMPIQRLENHVI